MEPTALDHKPRALALGERNLGMFSRESSTSGGHSTADSRT